jgi:glycosyltransferase involved in cell wall biosynthesis
MNQPEQPKTQPEPSTGQVKRVLMLCDFTCSTGFATVSHNIVKQLVKTQEFQLDIVGINYFGLPNEWQNVYPQVRVFPATHISAGDVYGREGFLKLLATAQYDAVFILQDTYIVEAMGKDFYRIIGELKKAGRPCKTIFYYPIDAPAKENWIKQAVSLFDYPVSYTEFGKAQSVKFDPELESRLRVIPHGVDCEYYFPMEKKDRDEFRSKYFDKLADGKFLVTNVNRNQPRKDIARTLQAFRLFKNIVPNAILYLHMADQDVGYGISELARNFDLIPDKDYLLPTNFDPASGVPLPVMNGIYNSSDLVMTTTLGEGWGLAVTESMSVGTPVIAPDHSSLTEMLADGRGTLVTAGKRNTDWVCLPSDNEILRPIVDVAELVDKMVHIHNHYDEYKKRAVENVEYVKQNLDWNIVCKEWLKVFRKATSHKKPILARIHKNNAEGK